MAEAAVAKKSVNWKIFLPPWLILMVMVVVSFINYEVFDATLGLIQTWILENFSWLFNGCTVIAVVILLITYVSPLKNIRLGGPNAKPMMSYGNFVWIGLCTILAAGITLWGCAEPMIHMYNPAAYAHAEPGSGAAINFAMNILYLEWSFNPMAIYCLAALTFAFVFFNMEKKYAIGSMIHPLTGDKGSKKINPIIDGFCLFCMTCGIAGSMGYGVIMIADGICSIFGGHSTNMMKIIIILCMTAAFVASASSGVMNGIRILSTVNSRFFLFLLVFVFVFGPTSYILDLTVETFGTYLSRFFELGLLTSAAEGDYWSRWWPTFFMCSYYAWMPITGLFLGKIGKGYSIKEFIDVIFFFPSMFSVIWMGFFGSSSIYFELHGAGISKAMEAGEGWATVQVFRNLPFSTLTILIFLIVTALSFITAADSNTNAMSGLCTEGLTADDTESPVIMKLLWGITGGVICVIFVGTKGVNGIKQLMNLGGFVGVFLFVGTIISWLMIMKNPSKYDNFKEGYDENGVPIKSVRQHNEAWDPNKRRGFINKLTNWDY